jgi:hypothetical protein
MTADHEIKGSNLTGESTGRVSARLCAWIVPEDVASGDLSDSGDCRISKLRVFDMWVRFDPPSRHQT